MRLCSGHNGAIPYRAINMKAGGVQDAIIVNHFQCACRKDALQVVCCHDRPRSRLDTALLLLQMARANGSEDKVPQRSRGRASGLTGCASQR